MPSKNKMPAKKIITIFCATGRQGTGAVKSLIADGTFNVRAVTRNPDSDAAKALAKLGAEVVKGDLDDKDSILAAMDGAYGVFGITNFWGPGVGPREEEQGKALVDAAKKARIQHFVWSTLERTDYKLLHFESKANVDDYLKASGVPRTSLYTAWFYENIEPGVGWRQGIKRDDDGSLVWELGILATDGEVPAISGVDCGVIAAAAFKNPERFIGKDIYATVEFTTPRKLAKQVESFLGVPLKIKELSLEQLDALNLDGIDRELQQMAKWFHYDSRKCRNIPETLEILPNHKTFAQVLAENGREGLLPK